MNTGRADPQFNGFRRADESFKRVQSQFSTEILAYELDLTSGRSFVTSTFADLPFAANSFYVDQNTDVGNATVLFANQQTPGTVVPVFVQPGFIARAPFTRLMIANSAQVGKKLRFFYGVDIDFVPSINGTLSIGTINGVVSVQEQGTAYGASFASTTALAANTPAVIVAPGTNVNGIVVRAASFRVRGQPGQVSAFIAKASAPASVIDGDVIVGTDGMAGDFTTPKDHIFGSLKQFVRIPAGKGLYTISTLLEDSCFKSVVYSLL